MAVLPLTGKPVLIRSSEKAVICSLDSVWLGYRFLVKMRTVEKTLVTVQTSPEKPEMTTDLVKYSLYC